MTNCAKNNNFEAFNDSSETEINYSHVTGWWLSKTEGNNLNRIIASHKNHIVIWFRHGNNTVQFLFNDLILGAPYIKTERSLSVR